MRLDINLASRPYEDARQFWTRWGTALAAAIILTLALIAITISGWRAARADHAQISELKAEIAQRDQIRQQAEDFLNRPENRTTRDESQFLNELIERKEFSWTHVLEDLEKVMPPRIHLVSIHPELDEDNQLSLKMEVAGDSRDRALELARRMEDSGRFTQTHIVKEHSDVATNRGGDSIEFEIRGLYVPEAIPVPAQKTTSPKTTSAKRRTP